MISFPRSQDIAAELETEEAKLTAMEQAETKMLAMFREILLVQSSGAGYEGDVILTVINDALSEAKSGERVALEIRIDELKEMLGYAEEREDRASYHRSVA